MIKIKKERILLRKESVLFILRAYCFTTEGVGKRTDQSVGKVHPI